MVLLVLLSRPADAQDHDATVDRAALCYATFDYDCVFEMLSDFDVRSWSQTMPREVVERAGRLLAISYIVRGVPDQGESIFRGLLEQWPDYRLSGSDLSPRYFQVFNRAHADVAAESTARLVFQHSRRQTERWATVIAAQQAAESLALKARDRAVATLNLDADTDVETELSAIMLEAGVSWQFFFKEDSGAFSNSLGFSLRVGTERLLPLQLSAAVDLHFHDVLAEDLVDEIEAELQVLNLVLNAAYPFYAGGFRFVRFAFGAGVGYSAFGFGDFGRGGLLLELSGQITGLLPGGLTVGIDVRQRLIIAEDVEGFALSTPLQIGPSIGYRF